MNDILCNDRFQSQLKKCLTNIARRLGLAGKNKQIVAGTMFKFLLLKLTLPVDLLTPSLELENLLDKKDLERLVDCLKSYPPLYLEGDPSLCYNVYLDGHNYPISEQKLYQALQ